MILIAHFVCSHFKTTWTGHKRNERENIYQKLPGTERWAHASENKSRSMVQHGMLQHNRLPQDTQQTELYEKTQTYIHQTKLHTHTHTHIHKPDPVIHQCTHSRPNFTYTHTHTHSHDPILQTHQTQLYREICTTPHHTNTHTILTLICMPHCIHPALPLILWAEQPHQIQPYQFCSSMQAVSVVLTSQLWRV